MKQIIPFKRNWCEFLSCCRFRSWMRISMIQVCKLENNFIATSFRVIKNEKCIYRQSMPCFNNVCSITSTANIREYNVRIARDMRPSISQMSRSGNWDPNVFSCNLTYFKLTLNADNHWKPMLAEYDTWTNFTRAMATHRWRYITSN